MPEPRGAQAPRLSVVQDAADYSDATDSLTLAADYGLTADEWQHVYVRAVMARRADGRMASSPVALSVPRQNGKNGGLEVVELGKLVLLGRRILHTAHEVKTARKAFARLMYFFGERAGDPSAQYPELNALVKEVRKTNGQEAIILHNGGSVEFVARSKGSGRGFSVDDLVMDECQELTEEALAALLPTISASPNPQVLYTGTPPGPKASGEVFTRLRTTALAGKGGRLAWLEWSCADGVDLDDVRAWAEANPALGIRLLAESIADERTSFSDEDFARERLGMWTGVAASTVINADTWGTLADPDSQAGTVAVGIDVAPDYASASVAVAGKRTDDRLHLEVLDNRKGAGWVPTYVAQVLAKNAVSAVVIDAASPAAALIPDLEALGVVVTTIGTRDILRATGALYRAALEDGLRHLDQPVLNSALAAGRKRKVGDSWLWHRQNASADITPLVAVTVAIHGATGEATEPTDNRMFVF